MQREFSERIHSNRLLEIIAKLPDPFRFPLQVHLVDPLQILALTDNDQHIRLSDTQKLLERLHDAVEDPESGYHSAGGISTFDLKTNAPRRIGFRFFEGYGHSDVASAKPGYCDVWAIRW